MSTRCQVIVKDSFGGELWFYRHNDGDPEGTMPSLEKFLQWAREGKIRDNVEQASGWLILIGALEYGTVYPWRSPDGKERPKTIEELFTPSGEKGNWECGAFEPSVPHEHGDIEYLYTIDLAKKEITYEER